MRRNAASLAGRSVRWIVRVQPRAAHHLLDFGPVPEDALAVGRAPGAGIADAQLQPDLEVVQNRLALEREGLLHGIDDHHEMTPRATAGNAGDHGGNLVDRREEVADQHDLVEGRDRGAGRQVVLERPTVRDEGLGDLLRDLPRSPGRHQAEEPDPLAPLHEGVREGEAEHQGALDLGRLGEVGHEAHRGGPVHPEPDRVRGLPFALAHVEPVVARRAAPIDPLRRLARHEGPELPEALALAGPAPAVDAVRERGRDPPRLENEARHAPGQGQRVEDLLTPGRTGGIRKDPGAGHDGS